MTSLKTVPQEFLLLRVIMCTVVQSKSFSCFVHYQQNILSFLWVIYDKAATILSIFCHRVFWYGPPPPPSHRLNSDFSVPSQDVTNQTLRNNPGRGQETR